MNRSPTTTVGPGEHPSSERSPIISDGIRQTWWTWARLALGGLVLAVLVVRLGAGPFLDGLRLTSTGPLVAATALTALTTLCCAWRWQVVAEGLGVRLSPWTAVAAVYRAQFLNASLPGGIVGDVDRALGHGRRSGAVGPRVRSVVWERTLGQVVQVVFTLLVVLVLPSPMRGAALLAGAVGMVVVVLALTAGLTGPSLAAGSHRLPARIARAVGRDLRGILRTGRARVGVVVGSVGAVTGHLVVFLVAARVAGVPATTYQLLPLAAVVLLAAALPLNVAGWGPREGVAAWAFGAAGLGLGAGVTTAVVYGVMALVATFPGAVVLLVAQRSRSRTPAPARPVPALEEAVHG